MNQKQQRYDDEISLKEIIERGSELWRYLLKKWFIILIAGIIGGAGGFLYAYIKPVRYISKLTFVVQENSNNVGGLASLAGQFGFDIGGGSSDGVFSGDNVLLFLKSEGLCRETLFTNYDSTGSILLVDKYAEINQLKQKWLKNKKIGKEIIFSKYKEKSLPRLEDSLLQIIVRQLLKKDISVDKPDKKSSFIEVVATTRDELFSKYFCERLVRIATDKYVESKIKVKALNVAKLQRRADSIAYLLNNKTYASAASQQTLVDVNPAIRTAPVITEIATRDKTMLATIFAEVVKNLEIAKVSLSQETPVIQIVDQSFFPLEREKNSPFLYMIASLVFVALFIVFVLFIIKFYK